MHGGGRNEDDPVAEMNMIPLIDISLTLLIIMMITTTFVKQPGFALKLPEAASRQGKPETPKDLVVAIDHVGDFWMDGKRSNDTEMLVTLRAAYEKNHDVRVLVKGDEGVPYGKVSHAMDIISQANIKHINLPTNPRPGHESTATPSP
jgi:biopolymer transport protein TolR